MKCDELKATEIYARFAEEVYDDFGDSPQEQEYYRKEHADAAIAELKAENRRLKRALWLARANRALEKIAWFKLWNASISTMNPEDGARQEFDKWKKNLGKCRAKAKEYK